MHLLVFQIFTITAFVTCRILASQGPTHTCMQYFYDADVSNRTNTKEHKVDVNQSTIKKYKISRYLVDVNIVSRNTL
ncbi:hypothetical protein SLEP1_g22936 [Rubroshorea leprosula]|uniref:Secreted protein n=1 Tax=Rubroshorea leprosula TaxID=152421 RepID=A0AAV5JAP8_9ROSI|nr:hypothetical protein SLEP1_g22936 [Rubroshorea leprosula]